MVPREAFAFEKGPGITQQLDDVPGVYFRGDPRLLETTYGPHYAPLARRRAHFTLYLSLEDDSIVGCRVKGISGILEDLPNYVQVNHGPYELSLVFLPFIGEATPDVRQSIGGLAKSAREHRLTLDHPAKESCSK